MDGDVVLPNLGFGMEEGRLIAWLKQPGDAVKRGEPIAEIESDKATVELEALVDGVLQDVLVAPDSVVPVGAVLAHIRTAGTEALQSSSGAAQGVRAQAEPASSTGKPQRVTPLARRMADEQGVNLSNVQGTGPGGRVTRSDVQSAARVASAPVSAAQGQPIMAAPAVRKLARDHAVELHQVSGTGKDGRVTRADVESVLERRSVPAAAAIAAMPVGVGGRHEIAVSTMRQAIARRLVDSAQNAPHIYVSAELDLTPALGKLPKGIGINNLLLYLTTQSLKARPELNATYENERLYQWDNVNLAIAVALPAGLIAPVLRHADDYSLSGLAERATDLITRARNNRLRSDELSGGTFTLSNLGLVKQIERFTAIINPPQLGILAVGAARPRPFVIDGGLYVRTTAHFTLSVDHRLVDGMVAARFLETFDELLQNFS